VKGTPVGPDLIQTEAFNVPEGEGHLIEFPSRQEPPTPDEALAAATAELFDAVTQAVRVFGEGMRRAFIPGYRWRDPTTGKYVKRKR
jgi:hypothetical protein